MSKLTVRIESTPSRKSILPWITAVRHGRQSIEAQCFALLGYPENELTALAEANRESARDTLELCIRLLNSFEHIPQKENELDEFFEKKALAFERQIKDHSADIPLHGAIGIVLGTRLLFCTSGDILALQISPNGITNLADVSRGGSLHFDNFRAGTLTQQSLLLFIPKSIGTLLKSEELKALYGAKSSERKLEYLQHLGDKKLSTPGGFRALLLQVRPAIQKSTETTAVSIANLLNTEARTEDLLSPPLLRPLLLRIKKAFIKPVHQPSVSLPAPLAETSQPTRPRSKSAAVKPAPPAFKNGNSLSSYLMRVSSRGKRIFSPATTVRRPAILSLPNWKQRLTNWSVTLRNRPGIAKLIDRFNTLPLKSKYLLLGVLLLIFIVAESILLTGRHRNLAQADGKIQDEIAAIHALLDNARASLIYNDEPKAREQTAEAVARLQAIPEFTKTVANSFNVSAWDGVVKTTNSPEVKDLAAAVSVAREKLRRAVAIENPVVITDAVRSTLDLKNSPPLALLFHNRKYELNPTDNQIYRFESTKDGFASGTPWIKDGTDVRSGTSFTIDGTLYVGDAAGRVIALRKGARFAFELKPIDPPLAHAGKIWTNEDSDYLYMLDPAEKRLLAFVKKTGLLTAQYVSPTFTDLKDFAIDEHAKVAYLLNGVNVVSIPLSNFTK